MNGTEDNVFRAAKPHENQLPDYHMHTALCRHAQGKVADYRNAAGTLGIPEICFVDHAPNPDGYDSNHRMNLNEFVHLSGDSRCRDGSSDPTGSVRYRGGLLQGL